MNEKEALRSLIRRIPDFDTLHSSRRLHIVAWFLHSYSQREEFTREDLMRCLDHLDMPTEIRRMSPSTNLIKTATGFRLDWRTREDLDKTFGPPLSQPLPLPEPATPHLDNRISSDKVFIVHGHNHPLKLELAYALQNAGLEVTILHEQPNRGMTIIEKFAAHAQDAGFAVVLLTADDTGAAKPAQGQPLLTSILKDRARQNVVFELGFFIGLLGRERVCALYEPGVEWPSDLNGIAYVEYDSTDRWIHQVAKELDAAGIKLDFSKLP
jgi:predicted nucleotide-binding protein